MGECCSNNHKCCCSCHSDACHSNSCHSNSCHEHSHSEEHEECGEYFLELADEAWSEVLKDKMKEYLLATQGEKLAELAKIVADSNGERWKHKMEKKHCCAEFREKLCSFFGRCKK